MSSGTGAAAWARRMPIGSRPSQTPASALADRGTAFRSARPAMRRSRQLATSAVMHPVAPPRLPVPYGDDLQFFTETVGAGRSEQVVSRAEVTMRALREGDPNGRRSS
jgi:hypothetical protein